MTHVLPDSENGTSVRWKNAVAGIHRGASVSRTHAGIFHSVGHLVEDPIVGGSTLTLQVRWEESLPSDSEDWEETLEEPLSRRSIESVGKAVLITGSEVVLSIEPQPR